MTTAMLRFAASLSFEAIRGEPFRGAVLITTTCQRSVLGQSQVHSHATPHRRCTGLIRSQNLDIKRACAALHQDHLALHVLVMHGAASIQWLRPHHGAVRKLVVHIVTQTRQAIPERRVPGRTQSIRWNAGVAVGRRLLTCTGHSWVRIRTGVARGRWMASGTNRASLSSAPRLSKRERCDDTQGAARTRTRRARQIIPAQDARRRSQWIPRNRSSEHRKRRTPHRHCPARKQYR